MTTVDYPPPPRRFVANEWLPWMADHPSLYEAITELTAEPDAAAAVIAWAVGTWESRQPDVDARIAANWERVARISSREQHPAGIAR